MPQVWKTVDLSLKIQKLFFSDLWLNEYDSCGRDYEKFLG